MHSFKPHITVASPVVPGGRGTVGTGVVTAPQPTALCRDSTCKATSPAAHLPRYPMTSTCLPQAYLPESLLRGSCLSFPLSHCLMTSDSLFPPPRTHLHPAACSRMCPTEHPDMCALPAVSMGAALNGFALFPAL